MKIIKGLRGIKGFGRGAVATIGVFDGVHLGHSLIIKKVVSSARKLGLKSVVFTFDPHPLKVLSRRRAAPSLISLAHRMHLIARLGADYTVVIKFTKAFAGIKAEKFIKDILLKRAGVRAVYVGENFYFGPGASTSANVLKKVAAAYGIMVTAIKAVKADNRVISSSRIRDLIRRGNIRSASRLLARPVSVLGTVVSGSRFARILGYPTANINPHHEVIPPPGVYAVSVRLGMRNLKGVLNIGTRPTFYSPRDSEPTIEVHIFDFHERIYGKDLEIFFIRKIRDERKFADPAKLIEQIRKDKAAARHLLR